MSQADVLVVGAGVSGLTTAVCLAESGARVRVVARERPEDTTSTAAGAVWAPYRIGGDPARINRWSQRSLEVFTALARSERSGVQMIVSMEVGHRPVGAPDWAPLLPGVRPCASDELPAGYAHGYRFVIPAIDMPPYLAYLLARLKDAGGTFQQDAVTSLEMVSGSVPAVVNCTGMGARELARDATLRPVRGQLVIIANPGVEIGLVEAEDEEDLTELTFLIPHRSTLVLGGTAEPDDERAYPDPDTTRAILARCVRLDRRVAGAPVLAERVGFRPERPEVRVAGERYRDSWIWHNYGHGGAGVTLSWGCAEEITTDVLAVLGGGVSATRR
jgi:D-amino-acid oxidase